MSPTANKGHSFYSCRTQHLNQEKSALKGKRSLIFCPGRNPIFPSAINFQSLPHRTAERGTRVEEEKNRSIYSLGPHSGVSFHSAHGEAEKNTHEASKPGKLFSIYAERPADGGLKLNHLLGPYLLPFPVWFSPSLSIFLPPFSCRLLLLTLKIETR